MFGTFLLPLRHLLFDDSWIDPIAARFDLLLLHFPEQAFVPSLERLRRLRVTLRQTAFEDLETSGE